MGYTGKNREYRIDSHTLRCASSSTRLEGWCSASSVRPSFEARKSSPLRMTIKPVELVDWQRRSCAVPTIASGSLNDEDGGHASLCPTRYLRRILHLQPAAPHLVFLDRFEQRLEVAFAKAVVALALDEFEEDRADRVGRENLQQHLGMAAIDHAFAIDQDAVTSQPRDV